MSRISLLALCATAVVGNPIFHRQVAQLDEAAFAEAQRRDETATRAFSDVQIRTSSGQCLFVDELSGDFRANLNPVQIAGCGTTDGQGWDVITSGKHNDQEGQALLVNTLTQACLNVDLRRPGGKQVNMFSCGGRADGGGEVTDSQLFAFDGGEGPLGLVPKSGEGQCLTVKGGAVDIGACEEGAEDQSFTFGDDAGEGGPEDGGAVAPTGTSQPAPATPSPTLVSSAVAASPVPTDAAGDNNTPVVSGAPAGVPTTNPTTPVPVSRAGGTLDPSSAAEANQFDDTATRFPRNVHFRGSNGKCFSVDPTAGDFRQNLIPIQFAECANVPNQKFDIVTAGRHNDGEAGKALLVSVLTQGCVSLDGRRAEGDTVTLFSCGGRAAGEGETDNAQLYPFDGSTWIVLSPESASNETCIVEGEDRLESAPCNGDRGQVFEIGHVP